MDRKQSWPRRSITSWLSEKVEPMLSQTCGVFADFATDARQPRKTVVVGMVGVRGEKVENFRLIYRLFRDMRACAKKQ